MRGEGYGKGDGESGERNVKGDSGERGESGGREWREVMGVG